MTNEKKNGDTLGGGLGCAFMIIAAGIFLSMPAIIGVIKLFIQCKK